jgi:hypothetical protein
MVLPFVKGIADTGFLVAFANRNDQYHDWAGSRWNIGSRFLALAARFPAPRR